MDNDSQAKWERFLDPEVLRPNLILASVYIAAFEVLKNSIFDRLRFFYVSGFDQNGDIISPEYKDEVLSKDRSLTYASLKWLQEAKAITDEDMEKFTKARQCRNLLAHEITKMLMEGLPPDFAERFNNMTALFDKIERWWIINFEIPINPDLAANIDKINLEGIVPGPIASLKMMIDVALGSNETATYYINEFKKGMSDG